MEQGNIEPRSANPGGPATKGAWACWNRFFFAPADPRPLALVRVAVGWLLLWNWVWLGVDLHAYIGSTAWLDPELAQSILRPGAWSLWFYIPDGVLWPVWAVGLIAIVMLTVGLASQVSAWVAWMFVVSTMRRAPNTLFGFDNVVAIWTLYLAVSFASGQAFSLDRLIRRRLRRTDAEGVIPTVSANVGLRLIQLHLCLIYASAGLAKLQGAPWWDGSAVGMLLGNSEFRPFDLTFLAENPGLIEFATHATVAFELLYPVLVWFRAWRPWVLGSALLLHAGIAVAMGLTEFSLVMLAGNLAFVSAAWLSPRIFSRARPAADPRVQSNAPTNDSADRHKLARATRTAPRGRPSR